jgi:hypothetical protein
VNEIEWHHVNEQLMHKNRRIADLVSCGDQLMRAARNCAMGCHEKTPERRELQAAMNEWVELREKP